MVELDREEVAWAGGLFEGEGCFTCDKHNRSLSARISMTDEDPVRRVYHALGGMGYIISAQRVKNTRKLVWTWGCAGYEKFQAVVAMLWPWLGERRRKRAAELLGLTRTQAVAHGSKTFCKWGHRFAGKNLLLTMRRGRVKPVRECRTCIRNRAKGKVRGGGG